MPVAHENLAKNNPAAKFARFAKLDRQFSDF
jgi:hypothetical protein